MKNLFITIFLLLFLKFIVVSQNITQNYQNTEIAIDKFLSNIKVNKKNFNIDCETNTKSYYKYDSIIKINFIYINLSDTLFYQKITKHIENYNDTINPWIRTALSDIYLKMYFTLANLKQNTNLRKSLLYNYFYLYGISNQYYGDIEKINDSSDFDKKTIIRINNILNGKTREDERQCAILLCQQVASNFQIFIPDTLNNPDSLPSFQKQKNYNYSKVAFEQMKIKNQTVVEWKDSIYNIEYQKRVSKCQTVSYKTEISPQLVEMIGKCKLRIFIPKLEKLYSEKKYLASNITTAFARMNYKDFLDIKLERIKKNIFIDSNLNYNFVVELINLNNQNAYEELGNLLISDILYNNCDKNKITVGWYIFSILMNNIENFPYKKTAKINPTIEELVYYEDICNYPKIYGDDALENAFEWMQKNQGHYIIKNSTK